MTTKMSHQKGSIIVYILIAIFLTGLLVSMMSQGAKKSASSEQIDEIMMYMQSDIQTVQTVINECVTSYQNNNFCPPSGCVNQFASVDATNPNPPFPTPAATGNGATGAALASIICPRAPAAQQTIFTGGVIQSMKALQDTANYTTTYFNGNNNVVANSGIEGVYLRIERTTSDPVWTETIARLNNKYSACSVAAVTPGNTDPTGHVCTNGCLYYWIVRLPTSSAAWKAGCP